MPSIGTFDPDENDTQAVKEPAWKTPKTELGKSMLSACGRKKFKDRTEQRAWKTIEEKTLGFTEEDYLYLQWVKSRIQLWREKNSKSIVRPLNTLISHINNEDWRIDWTSKNRERLLKARQQIGATELEKQILTIKEK